MPRMPWLHQKLVPTHRMQVSIQHKRQHAHSASPGAANSSDGSCQGGASVVLELAVVVHVLNDYAFKKYLDHCSASDLMLLRGLLLKVGE